MTAAEALASIAPVIREVLDRPDLDVTAAMTARTFFSEWRRRLRPDIIGAVESTPLSQQITRWLGDWRQGDQDARDRLFAVVHPQLQQIASRFLHHERGDHTLEPNALVNELCVRLLGAEPITFNDRVHFFAVAAQTMRRILIDHARARVAEDVGARPGVRVRAARVHAQRDRGHDELPRRRGARDALEHTRGDGHATSPEDIRLFETGL